MSLQADQKELRELILEMLESGPRPVKTIVKSLPARFFSLGQLKTAKKQLDIKSIKKGGTGTGWLWKQP